MKTHIERKVFRIYNYKLHGKIIVIKSSIVLYNTKDLYILYIIDTENDYNSSLHDYNLKSFSMPTIYRVSHRKVLKLINCVIFKCIQLLKKNCIENRKICNF